MTNSPLKVMIKGTILIFKIVNFQFLDGDVVYVSQLTDFAKVCSIVDNINNGNTFVVSKELKQNYRYKKLQKSFFFLIFITQTHS